MKIIIDLIDEINLFFEKNCDRIVTLAMIMAFCAMIILFAILIFSFQDRNAKLKENGDIEFQIKLLKNKQELKRLQEKELEK
jgi:hypothetical protein